MFKKTKKFLWTSFVSLIILCIIIFVWLGIFMSRKSEEAISEIGKIYMSEMNKQLEEKFKAVTELRIEQIEGIVRRTPPAESDYGKKLLEELSLSASVRDFSFLGLYSEDGECETIYGEDVEYLSQEEFKTVLKDDSQKITSGMSSSGEKLLLLGVNAEYPMKNGKKSVALIAGTPMKYLEEALVLEEEGNMVYSHIVRADGGYVVRSGESYQDNYFNRIKETVSKYRGKTPEGYAEELEQAMSEKKDYSTLIMADGIHHHLYCSSLPGAEWYLISIMPYGVLDDAIDHLNDQRQFTMLGACGVILAAVLIIFVKYFRMSQQQLRQLEKAERVAISANKAKSEFLSNMSHDIRTPMNGIVGMTSIAMANFNDPPRVQDCLKKISMSSRHLLGLINDVLDMSKIESGKLSLNLDLVSLRDAMESLVNIVQPQIKEKGQHFDIFIQRIETEEVCCDGVRLNQILLNLLSNAVKFTPAEGRINVYLNQEASPRGEKYVRCHFRVKDNGIGMSEEFQEKLFDSFSREDSKVQKIEGTGLGMAITKYIVDMMEGTIEVDSSPGMGTEFHVALDLEKADVQGEDMMLPPWHMLVVDNNEDLCRSAVEALKDIGVTADWVQSGREALVKVEERHKRHDDYQVVLLDWKMPDMDGLHTTSEIRRITGEGVPILIISAYDWSDIEEEALAAGAQGFISKPLFKSNLYVGLSRCIKGVGAVEESKDEKVHDFTGCKVLLAEDNELNWEIAQDILSEVGFEVEWAENGQICVEKFSQAEVGYYDVVLMDIRMPVMNGYEASKAIRALPRQDADIPIIAMTADAFAEDIQRSQESGMNAHIAKPIDIGKLMSALKKYLK